jgi:DNA polymerase-3 subunit delta
MDASAKKILDDLKAGKYAPLYLLQGEETYYIDLIANYIEHHVLTESEKGFNQVVLYGKDTPVNTLLTHARRFPMMSERQVVIVREAQEIPDLQKDIGSKLMLDYVARPVPSTVLVLCHKYKTLDKRRELGKKIEQYAVTGTFKKPYENQLPDFVAGYFKDRGAKAEDAAIRVLCEYTGNDLNRLTNEIDKVLAGLASGVFVTAAMVMEQVGVSREYNIFELQKAMINKDTLTATKIVMYFEGNTKKNPVIPLVAFLYSFFSKLLVATTASDRSDKELTSLLKISSFAVRDYSNALQRYPSHKIIENISLLKQADLRLKGVGSGSETDGQLLKELIYRLM